jgi:type II secretory pathway pseudopilin PulG
MATQSINTLRPGSSVARRLGTRADSWYRRSKVPSERGVTLIETMMAAAMLLIVAAGLLPVFVLGIQATNQQGDMATRTTEYAQDKMEQLLNLNSINITSDGFNDGTTDTTVFPAKTDGSTGCTGTGGNICGLGGTMLASSTVGSIPPAASVTWYVDYLDVNGNLLSNSTGAYYTRQWSVSTDSTATLKTITVVATSLQAAGVKGLAPSTKLVSIKSSGL